MLCSYARHLTAPRFASRTPGLIGIVEADPYLKVPWSSLLSTIAPEDLVAAAGVSSFVQSMTIAFALIIFRPFWGLFWSFLNFFGLFGIFEPSLPKLQKLWFQFLGS